ncbi:MAG: hypothetical protein ACXAEN_14355 [Candidatus Thorarchaeota archaeon]|jgi:hypothetical protein
MSKWLKTIIVYTELPARLKWDVEDARDQGQYLGVDQLGVAEIRDGEDKYYLIRKDDFEEWFGD